jgi:hypothetical protein
MTEQVAEGRHEGVRDFGVGLRLVFDGLEAIRGEGG